MTGGLTLSGRPSRRRIGERKELCFRHVAGDPRRGSANIAGRLLFCDAGRLILRIAVGPANQAMDTGWCRARTQAFLPRPIVTVFTPHTDRWPPRKRPGRSADGKADSRDHSGDLDVPKNARPWQTLSKNVEGAGVAPGREGQRQGKAELRDHEIPQISGTHRIGASGRTRPMFNLLKVIAEQYVVDPSKVEIVQSGPLRPRRHRNQKADAYLAAGPVNSKDHRRGRSRAFDTDGGHADLPPRSIPPRRSRKNHPM